MKKVQFFATLVAMLFAVAGVSAQQTTTFDRFAIILPQDGEKMVATPEQIKAAIVTILSPKQGETFAGYQKRADEFGRAFVSVQKNYSAQLAVVQEYYTKVSVGLVSDLVAPKCRPEENIMVKSKDEVSLEPGQKWTPFVNFREDAVGQKINPAGTDEEVFARVRKQIGSAIEQVLRTNYDPFMKSAWIDALNAFKEGKTGSEAGSPRIELIRKWSNEWEITRGKNSVLENAEFRPAPKWRDAKAIVFKLDKFCREVGHALPCGLNPIVPKYRTVITTEKRQPPEEPAVPQQCQCDIITMKTGDAVTALEKHAEIYPDQFVVLEGRIAGDKTLELRYEWTANGLLQDSKTRWFTFRPADFAFQTGITTIKFNTIDQFGRRSSCMFVIVVKPRPAKPVTEVVTPPPAKNPPPTIHKGCGKKCWLIPLIGAAVVGGVVAAQHGGGKSPVPNPIEITKPGITTPGPASVGAVTFSWGGKR